MHNLKQPVLAVGAVVFHHDRILLVERKHAPNQGQWAIPGGKLQLGETLRAAAEREILEETGITIKAGDPIYTFEVIKHDPQGNIQFHYVVIDLRAEYIAGQPSAADDVSAAAWVDRDMFASLHVNNITKDLLRTQFNFPA
jgi:8-oxo-dGTP diphosphatase